MLSFTYIFIFSFQFSTNYFYFFFPVDYILFPVSISINLADWKKVLTDLSLIPEKRKKVVANEIDVLFRNFSGSSIFAQNLIQISKFFCLHKSIYFLIVSISMNAFTMFFLCLLGGI